MDSTLIISIIALVVLGIGILFIFLIQHYTNVIYVRAKILTDGELRFFKVLQYAIYGKYSIFAQVRVANLVKIPDQFFLWKNFNPLGAKCVDFVLYDKNTGSTVLVLELDDKSHLLEKRIARDKFVDKVLQQARIPILHLKYQQHYEAAEILKSIEEKIRE